MQAFLSALFRKPKPEGGREMKIGDKIRIKIDHGYWKKGHEGIIEAVKMKG